MFQVCLRVLRDPKWVSSCCYKAMKAEGSSVAAAEQASEAADLSQNQQKHFLVA